MFLKMCIIFYNLIMTYGLTKYLLIFLYFSFKLFSEVFIDDIIKNVLKPEFVEHISTLAKSPEKDYYFIEVKKCSDIDVYKDSNNLFNVFISDGKFIIRSNDGKKSLSCFESGCFIKITFSNAGILDVKYFISSSIGPYRDSSIDSYENRTSIFKPDANISEIELICAFDSFNPTGIFKGLKNVKKISINCNPYKNDHDYLTNICQDCINLNEFEYISDDILALGLHCDFAFENCINLKNIRLTNVSNIVYTTSMCKNCINLEEITSSCPVKFELADETFSGCVKLSNIDNNINFLIISPNSFSTNLSCKSTFKDCRSLSVLNVRIKDLPNLSRLENSIDLNNFSDGSGIKEFNVDCPIEGFFTKKIFVNSNTMLGNEVTKLTLNYSSGKKSVVVDKNTNNKFDFFVDPINFRAIVKSNTPKKPSNFKNIGNLSCKSCRL